MVSVLLTLSLIVIGIGLYPDCAVNTVKAAETGEAESATEKEDLQTEGGVLTEESSAEEAGESKAEQIEYITDSQLQGENTVSGNDVGTVTDEAEEVIHQPKILLQGCNLSGAELGIGSTNWLEASFKNLNESETIYNLKVTVTGSSFIQFIPGSFYFSTVNSGEEIRLEGELKIDVNAESGTAPVYFEFEYENEKGNAINGKESISVRVAQQPIVHQPKLLMESCNLSGKDLGMGSQKQMTVSFKNCSNSQTIYNLKVAVSTGYVLQLIPGSFHFAQIGPREVIHIEGNLKVASKAESGMIPLGFELEYEDEKGTAIVGKESSDELEYWESCLIAGILSSPADGVYLPYEQAENYAEKLSGQTPITRILVTVQGEKIIKK